MSPLAVATGRPLMLGAGVFWGALRLSIPGILLTLTGCMVPQPRGEGTLQSIVEPTTKRPYYLYLPKEYVRADAAGRAARRWPVVVTFHGMKPYDVAYSQAREWEQEADRYGYIVVAPELLAFDFVFGEFPQRSITRAFKSDELAILAILDHVFETTAGDPNNVLSTSWSSGGYMAHYMLNRHPERFTCLAVRQSDFSASLLDSIATVQSIYHPILVVSTQNDVPICREESREAIRWYESHGYKNFGWVYLNHLGHERTPDTAADFFAHVAGVTPNRPPDVLVGRQAIDGNTTGLALMAGNLGQLEKPPGFAAGGETYRTTAPPSATPRRPVMVAVTTPPSIPEPAPPAEPEPAPPPGAPTPERGSATAAAPRASSLVAIRVSSAIGFEPLLLVYTADCPSEWHRTAQFHWSLDGKDLGQGLNGQRTIAQPGDYLLALRVVTKDGATHEAARRIRVLKSLETTALPSARAGQ